MYWPFSSSVGDSSIHYWSDGALALKLEAWWKERDGEKKGEEGCNTWVGGCRGEHIFVLKAKKQKKKLKRWLGGRSFCSSHWNRRTLCILIQTCRSLFLHGGSPLFWWADRSGVTPTVAMARIISVMSSSNPCIFQKFYCTALHPSLVRPAAGRTEASQKVIGDLAQLSIREDGWFAATLSCPCLFCWC